MMINQKQRESKTQLAKKLGVARSSLYYQSKLAIVDEELGKQILIWGYIQAMGISGSLWSLR